MFDKALREMWKLERGVQISIDLKLDDNRFLDRCCPSEKCGVHFKVAFDDWREIVSDDVVYCPRCRHEAQSTEWKTSEQATYFEKSGIAYAKKHLDAALQSDARKFNSRQSKDSFVQMSMSYNPGKVQFPVPPEATDIMAQEIKCQRCRCRYSINGDAFFCPACGNKSG